MFKIQIQLFISSEISFTEHCVFTSFVFVLIYLKRIIAVLDI